MNAIKDLLDFEEFKDEIVYKILADVSISNLHYAKPYNYVVYPNVDGTGKNLRIYFERRDSNGEDKNEIVGWDFCTEDWILDNYDSYSDKKKTDEFWKEYNCFKNQ